MVGRQWPGGVLSEIECRVAGRKMSNDRMPTRSSTATTRMPSELYKSGAAIEAAWKARRRTAQTA